MNRIIKAGLIVTGALLMTMCSKKEAAEEVKVENKIRPVKTKVLQMEDVERSLSYTANIIAFEELHYAPAQPGRIKAINVEVGDRVKKGQELVQMEQTQLTQALLQVDEAKRNYLRMDTLYSLNSIPKQQYDQAKYQYDIAVSNLDFLQDNISLKAPFNAVITGKYYEAGELYSGAPNTAAGKAAIVTLMQISSVKAIVNISEQYFAEIKSGMQAFVQSDVYGDKVFDGRVFKVYPTIDAATRTFKVEVLISNQQEELRPGMYAKVYISLKNDKAMLVSAISVVKEEGTNNRYVFLNNNGVANKIRVEIGMRKDDKVELISDQIQQGAELIVAGQANLMDGDKIEVRN